METIYVPFTNTGRMILVHASKVKERAERGMRHGGYIDFKIVPYVAAPETSN